MDNREIVAYNLKRLMKDKTPKKVCDDLDIKLNTYSDWLHAKTYPRIEKLELLADYFGVDKLELTESKEVINKIKKYEKIKDIVLNDRLSILFLRKKLKEVIENED